MNSRKIALLTDSCCDLPAELAKQLGFYIVPLRILCADGEHADGADIFPAGVYERLEAGECLSTSLPAPEAVEQALDEIRAAGYEKVIALMLSSGLSGTYNLMRLAGEECSDLEVAVFDSLSGSLGSGMMILQLLQDIEAGMSWQELTEKRVPWLIEHTYPYFSVDTLEYLQRGGRIGRITAMAGTMLNIKPVLTFAGDGQLVNVAKLRGTKQVMEKFISLVADHKGEHTRYNLAVANGRDPGHMGQLQLRMAQQFAGYDNFWQGEIGATLSAYIGPGVLGAAITVLDGYEESGTK